jgi:YggT family protein
MLLDAIGKIELFISVFAGVYVLVLFLYVMTSWIKLPYQLGWLQRFLYDACDPYLRLWRRVIPFSAGPIDFTPMVAIVAVIVFASIVNAILNRF